MGRRPRGGCWLDRRAVCPRHGTAGYSDLLSLLPVIDKAGSTPFVRLPWLDEAAIMRARDAGALGIIAPMIETADDAARFVSACRCPPAGRRSFGPIRARFARGDGCQQEANGAVLALAMVETREAVADLDAIPAVPGLSGICIGPADLLLAYGFPAGFDRNEPELRALIADIRGRCAANGLRCCLHCGSPVFAAQAVADGMDLVTVGSDVRSVGLVRWRFCVMSGVKFSFACGQGARGEAAAA